MQHNYYQHVLVAIFIIILLLSSTTSQSNARELRPSDHGLSYQQDASSSPPTKTNETQEMNSFFRPTRPSLPLPKAQSIGNGTWWNVGRSREDTRMRHVRMVLLVASGVCGLIGAVLLIVSGVVYIFRLRKRDSNEDRVLVTSAPVTMVPHTVVVGVKK